MLDLVTHQFYQPVTVQPKKNNNDARSGVSKYTMLFASLAILFLLSNTGYAKDRFGCVWRSPPDPSWLELSHEACRSVCLIATESNLGCADVQKCGDHCRDAKSCTSAGNPIELLSGTKTHTESDYRGGGQYPLTVTRNYSSSDRFTFDNFGKQWSGVGTQYIHAQFLAAGQERMTVVRPNGDKVRYWLNAAGDFDPISHGTKAVLDIFDFNGQAIFQYITSSGVEEVYRVDLDEYNATGETRAYLWWTTSREGIKHRYDIDTTGRLLSVSDDFGRQLTYSYYSSGPNAGKISSIQLPGNRELTYQYDLLGNLEFVIYPDATPNNSEDNPRKQYHYEDPHLDIEDINQDGDSTDRLYPHHLTGITDERGNRYATYAYNDQGWAILSEHAGGADRMEILEYKTTTTRIRNAANKETTFTFSAIGTSEDVIKRVTQVEGHPATYCDGDLSSITYDANGFKDTEVDRNGNTTDYTFDSDGFESQRIEAQGTGAERTIVSIWDKNIYKPISIETVGHKRTEYGYDDKGRIDQITETDLLTTGNPTRTWDYSYTFHFFDFNNDGIDDETNVATISIDGPRTDVVDQTIQTFNPEGLLTQVTNALGHTTQFQNHSPEGLPQTMVDGNNVMTEMRYTLRGWLDTRTVKSAAGDAITDYDYYDNGLVSRITLPNGVQLNYDYDAAQRLIRITNSDGEFIEYGLNALGNRELETISSSSGVIVRQQQQVFDELGRLKQSIGVDNQILEEFDYDGNGNIVTIIDNNLASIVRVFDGLNRLAQETDRGQDVTEYTYDDLDQLNTVTDANGLVTDYDYNGFGFLTRLTSPDTGVTQYTSYDLAGNLTAKTDARGVVTQYTYDALGRLVDVIFPANPAQNYSFTYDSVSGGNKGVGQRTGVTRGSNSIAWQYDDRGNAIEDRRIIGNDTLVTQYGYDLADNLTQIIYPNGRIVNYQRDAQTAQVTAITTRKSSTAPLETLASGIDYQPFGPVNRITFANGLTQTKTYDLHYRPDTLVTNDGGSIQLQNLDYGFDPVGTLNPITDNLNTADSQTFSYDNQYRLTNATGNYGSFQYVYDATGNRTARSLIGSSNNFSETLNYTSPLTTNQLQGVSGGNNPRTFTYTDNGNLAGDSTGQELIYDDNNRLVEVKNNAASVANYGYNALGQRDSKTTLNGTGHFVYGLDSRLLFETIPGSTTLVSRTYVYLDGMPIAMLEDMTPMQAASMVPTGPLGVLALVILAAMTYRYRHRVLQNQTVLRGFVVPLLAIAGLACGGGDPGSGGGGETDTNTYFYINDHLGTPQLLTNSEKVVVWAGDYTPFGEVDEVVNQVQQPLRFPGQYHDVESGLYYNLMRDYDPVLGTYIQSDRLDILGQTHDPELVAVSSLGILRLPELRDKNNLYLYSIGNPIMNVDIYGLHHGEGCTAFNWLDCAGLQPAPPPISKEQQECMDEKGKRCLFAPSSNLAGNIRSLITYLVCIEAVRRECQEECK